MPLLKKIVVQDYRNIVLEELEFSPNVNCICGLNGAGKTNLLDAVYYLSMTKSAFASADRYNFRHLQHMFTIAGDYEMASGINSRFSIRVEEGAEKKMFRDGKPYSKVSFYHTLERNTILRIF